jgi:hypothetical protein
LCSLSGIEIFIIAKHANGKSIQNRLVQGGKDIQKVNRRKSTIEVANNASCFLRLNIHIGSRR